MSSTTESSTVLVKGLHPTHVLRNIGHMFDRYFDEDNYEGEPSRSKDVRDLGSGEALIRFPSTTVAEDFVTFFDGEEWKAKVVHLECVPDNKWDDLIKAEHQQKEAGGKTAKLVVTGLKPGADRNYVQAIFLPLQLKDVNIPKDGEGMAYVFLTEEDGEQALKKFPKSFQNRMIYVKLAEKKKRVNRNPKPPPHWVWDPFQYEKMLREGIMGGLGPR